jgi:hypothetical protein
MPNLAWIRKGYHGYSACTTDNAVSAQVNTKFYKYSTSITISVTACIGIQLHLSEFRKNSEKQGYM